MDIELVLFGVALFAILSLAAISAYRLLSLGPDKPPPPPKPKEPAPEDDTALIRFFMKLDPEFRRQFPSLAAKAEGQPRPAAPSPTLAQAPAAFAPAVISERAQPRLISEGPMPVPSSIRPDPPAIGSSTFSAPVPSLPETTAEPDADLVAIVEVWDRLSERDKHELRRIAEMKSEGRH